MVPRRFAFVSFAGLALGMAPLDDAVHFGGAVLKKGARCVVTSSMETTTTTVTKGNGNETKMAGTARVEYAFSVDVTAAEESGVRESVVKIDRAHMHGKMEAMVVDNDMPGMGRSWRAVRNGDAWNFTEQHPADAADKEKAAKAPADGADALGTTPVAGDEAEFLKLITTGLLTKAPLANALAGKVLKVGDKITVAPADIPSVFATFAMPVKLTSLELEFAANRKEGDTDAGIFIAKAGFDPAALVGLPTDKPEKSEMIVGELAVSTSHSIVLRGSFSGPLAMEKKIGDDQFAMTMSMTGQMSWKFSTELK